MRLIRRHGWLLLLTSCFSGRVGPADSGPDFSVEEVQVTVFEEAMRAWPASDYCLVTAPTTEGIDGSPSPAVVARVRKETGLEAHDGFARCGQPDFKGPVIVTVRGARREGADTLASVGLACGPMCGYQAHVALHRVDGGWSVVRRTTDAVY